MQEVTGLRLGGARRQVVTPHHTQEHVDAALSTPPQRLAPRPLHRAPHQQAEGVASLPA